MKTKRNVVTKSPKMKSGEIPKVEELGISPAPWKVENSAIFPVDAIFDAKREVIAGLIRSVDCKLTSAAPEMYEALRDLVEVVEWCEEGGIVAEVLDAVVENARAALRKAAGVRDER